MTLPLPVELGAPAKYLSWRSHQPRAILTIAENDRRFTGSVLPTGAGKTLTVASAALLMGWRTAFLTSTKMLQEQYSRDLNEIGLVDVRGQGSYACAAFDDAYRHLRERPFHGCDEGPCRAGLPCDLKPLQDEQGVLKGCASYDAIATAYGSNLVVTNYKYWFNANQYRPTLGHFDCLVLDEAHHAPTELADYLSTTWDAYDAHAARSTAPEDGEAGDWAAWAKQTLKGIGAYLDERPRTRAEFRKHKQLRKCAQKLATLQQIDKGEWVIQRKADTWHFDPVHVGAFNERLFRHIPHIVCTSATFTRKTAEMMGIPVDEMTWHEAPSDFPAWRRPVYFVPTVKVDYKADESQIRLWLAQIDNFLRRRQDRKGIIHAVSYQRAKQIRDYSEFASRMILHDKYDTRDRVAEFRAAGPGAILVSPSVTTGYDFAGTSCEFQVIAKIPFPDRRNPVTEARTKHDADYPAYIAMQELVQAVGRGMRSAEDQCETAIFDSNCGWFMKKYADLAPTWFLEAYRRSETLPEPLRALGEGVCDDE